MRASSMAATPKKPISDESKELQSIIGETERKLKSKNSSNVNIASSVPFVVFDTLLWQTFASVLIPGATINLIVRASKFAIAGSRIASPSIRKWFPTFMGLGSIPVIIHPIDNFVDLALENTTRKWCP
mmetsp:Transcript_30222/g.69280  ORF Transcript_30222/g.69280 Transcript_30222/m.69280 type:complete len:128 (-) Transcript_30222:2898-3281(-)